MRIRRAGVLLALVVAAACGGSPTSPSPTPTPTPTPTPEPEPLYRVTGTAVYPAPTCHAWTPPRAMRASVVVTWIGLANLELTVHRWDAAGGTTRIGVAVEGLIGERGLVLPVEPVYHALCLNRPDVGSQSYTLTVREVTP